MRTRQHLDSAHDSPSTDSTAPNSGVAGRADRDAASDRPDTAACDTGRPGSPGTVDAPSPAPAGTASGAPLTFDPFCTRRCRNLADGENAATPDPEAVTVVRVAARRRAVADD